MIHTVKIDDSTVNGKKMIKELSKYKKGIEFDNPAVSGVIPEGYMTGDEFARRVKESVTKFYKENGLI